MKMDKNKLITFIISGVIIASAGGYAYADQAMQKAVMASQPSVESNTSSESVSTEVQPMPETAVSSTMESIIVSPSVPEKTEESKVTESSSSISSAEAESSSAAAKTTEASSVTQSSSETANSSSSGTVSLIVDVCYYDIIDPGTGNYINARDPQYAKLQEQLGGDAGKIEPAHSTACQAALKKYIAAHPEDTRYTAPSNPAAVPGVDNARPVANDTK